jgi:hypothetical protein
LLAYHLKFALDVLPVLAKHPRAGDAIVRRGLLLFHHDFLRGGFLSQFFFVCYAIRLAAAESARGVLSGGASPHGLGPSSWLAFCVPQREIFEDRLPFATHQWGAA